MIRPKFSSSVLLGPLFVLAAVSDATIIVGTPWQRHVIDASSQGADGTRLTIRPVRPEDAVLEREFVNGLSDRSRYLRFMLSLKSITPQMVSRFTQIDYDREMALIALVPGKDAERQVAVGRYVADPDGRACEFAIVVDDAWHHKGIATELLRRLIDVARDRRIRRMDGIVLRENEGMLRLARDLGFERQSVPEDPQLVRVSLDL